jgi:hypothetical protein
MAVLTIDFETYYDQQYSLKKMTTAEYILDHRFQVILCSFKLNNEPSTVEVGFENVQRRLNSYDWSKLALCAYHVRFDGSILAWHFGIVPKLYLDPLSMARATTHAVVGRSSLAAVSKYLELPDKGDAVVRAVGKRLEDFTGPELWDYADYCNRDNENCFSIFTKMKKIFSPTELRLIDLVARMHILPQVKLDPGPLAEHLAEVKARKQEILDRVSSIGSDVFRSNPQFVALLESYGVDVPMKISPTTGRETFALAKGDREFKELCMDPDQPLEVQALLAARTSQKSTLEETRTQKLLDHSLLDWRERGEQWAVVPLKYSGARTHRLSGDDKTNWQNFARMSPIRAGIVAPPGYRIVHRDASQIEARMVAWLAKCEKLLRAFREKRDVYSEFATTVYGQLVTTADTKRRFVGKTGILGLGYGCGPLKFRHMLFLGNGGISVEINLEESTRIVYHYRSEYPEIPVLWSLGGHLLLYVLVTSRGPQNVRSLLDIDYLKDRAEQFPVVKPGFDCLWLPSGLCLMYPNLRHERMPDNSYQLIYDNRTTGGYFKIYGGKVIENISQALSRIIVTDSAVRIFDLTGYHPFLSTHDSLDYCVPESEVEWWHAHLEKEFAIRPTWAPDLPLASEGGWGRTLLAAEKKENS